MYGSGKRLDSSTIDSAFQGLIESGAGCALLASCRRPILNATTSPLYARRHTRQFRLDGNAKPAHFPDSSRTGLIMSRECCITGAKPAKGHVIHRRGMAKK